MFYSIASVIGFQASVSRIVGWQFGKTRLSLLWGQISGFDQTFKKTIYIDKSNTHTDDTYILCKNVQKKLFSHIP